MDQISSSGASMDDSDVTDLDQNSPTGLVVGNVVDDESDTAGSLPYNNFSLSDTDSLPDTLSDSGTSSVESVNSAAIHQRWEPTPKPEAARFRRPPRKTKKSGPQFLEFSKELRDVPGQTVWDIIKDHKGMANVCPGIVAGVDFLQGDGGTGSIFVITLNPRYTPPGADNYVIHKLEVSDDVSRTYAVRCVGGMHQKRYHHYLSSVEVVPHEVLGDSSCVVIWRLEYKLRNRHCQVSEETKSGYMNCLEIIRDRHLRLDRVERPIVSNEMVIQRLKLQARQRRIGVAEQEREDPSDRSRKSRAQLSLNDSEGVDRDGQKKQRPRRNTSNKLKARGSGSG